AGGRTGHRPVGVRAQRRGHRLLRPRPRRRVRPAARGRRRARGARHRGLPGAGRRHPRGGLRADRGGRRGHRSRRGGRRPGGREAGGDRRDPAGGARAGGPADLLPRARRHAVHGHLADVHRRALRPGRPGERRRRRRPERRVRRVPPAVAGVPPRGGPRLHLPGRRPVLRPGRRDPRRPARLRRPGSRAGGPGGRAGRGRRVPLGAAGGRPPADDRRRHRVVRAVTALTTAGEPGPLRTARLRAGWLGVGIAALVVAAGAGLLIGPVTIAPDDVVRLLLGLDTDLTTNQLNIVREIRLPRVVLGLLVGATLSAAGAGYQGVFRNPLADPYLLGAAAGAGLGVTLVIVRAAEGSGTPAAAPVAAFAG